MKLEKLPILKSYFSTCNLSQVYFDPVGEKINIQNYQQEEERRDIFCGSRE